ALRLARPARAQSRPRIGKGLEVPLGDSKVPARSADESPVKGYETNRHLPFPRDSRLKLDKSLNKTVPDPLKGFQHAFGMGVDAYGFDMSILGDEMMDTPRKRASARVVSFPGTGRAERAATDEGRERQLLDMILNNMSQGVLMFDADMR